MKIPLILAAAAAALGLTACEDTYGYGPGYDRYSDGGYYHTRDRGDYYRHQGDGYYNRDYDRDRRDRDDYPY